MDPVTAIGLASAILAFVEFSWSLVRGAGDVYRSPSGASQENTSIGTIIADLEDVADNINTDIQGRGKHENALTALAKGCEDLSKELLQVLEKLKKRSDSKREALKATLRSMRKEKEVASIEKRLGEYRAEIVLRLNLVLCNQQSAIKEQLDAIQYDRRNFASETITAIGDLRSMVSDTMDQLKYEHGNPLVDPMLWETKIVQLGQVLRESLLALNTKLLALPKETIVLRRLFFDTMFRREDDISGPGYGTFEWVLEDIRLVKGSHIQRFDSSYRSNRTEHRSTVGKSSSAFKYYGNRDGWDSNSEFDMFNTNETRGSRKRESEVGSDIRMSNGGGSSDEQHQANEDDQNNKDNEASIIFGQTDGQQFVKFVAPEFGRNSEYSTEDEWRCSDPEVKKEKDDSVGTRESYSADEGSYCSSDSETSGEGVSSTKNGTKLDNTTQSTKDTPPLKNHQNESPSPQSLSSGSASPPHSKHIASGSTKDTPAVRLHGVYYRSGPSISKIHGSEPLSWYSGWAPHLEHIMSVSERAKRQRISMAFASFLRKSHGVFFCCGKAGSGKSTFMKYISGHQEIRRQLESWSGDKKLVIISVFFWNSGDELQMSMEGFYRSLLFQVVQQCPEVLPAIFPDHSLQADDIHEGIRGRSLPFRFSELQGAIRRLLETSEIPSHRLCFFIDGLDEYKGDSKEHFSLAQLLKNWATKDVKIICSARPYIEFLDTFTDSGRTIQLHEWTKDDIYRYVLSELHTGLGSDKMPLEAITRLVEIVSRKADGVFIWAQLVVQSLLEGIAHRDSIRMLHGRVDQAPRDLNSLYERSLSSIDSTIRRRADDALSLVARSPFGTLNALAFSWLDELEDEDFPLNRPFQIYTIEEVEDREETAKRQVALLTKGLVEMRRAKYFENTIRQSPASLFRYTLDYYHLTAHEFLMNRVAPDRDSFSETLRDRYARLALAEIKFSGALRGPSSQFRTIYAAGHNKFHDIPDRYLDELRACYPTTGTSQNDPQQGTHVGLYDAQSRGSIQIDLWGRATPWRPDNSICHLVWKGSDPSLIICYALSLHQAGYVLRKLQNGVADKLSEEELAVWLLATWTIFPDPSITEYILSRRGLPQRPVEIRNFFEGKNSDISCWFGFLMSFSRTILTQTTVNGKELGMAEKIQPWNGPFTREESWEGKEWYTWIEMQCRNLEHLLKHGVDKDVIFLLGGMPVDQSPQADKPIHPWDVWVHKWDEWVLDQGTIFYVDLLTMLDLIQPPPANLNTLQELLRSSPANCLQSTCSSLSRVRGYFCGRPCHSLGRDTYKALKTEDLKRGQLRI